MAEKIGPELSQPDDEVDLYENSVEVELHLIPRRPYGYVRRWVLWESPCHRGAEAEARRRYDDLIPELLHPPFLLRSTAESTGSSYEIRLSLMGPEREEAHTVLGRFRTRGDALRAYRQLVEHIYGPAGPFGHWGGSAASGDDNSSGLLGLSTLSCGRPLYHHSAYLSTPPLRYVHCLDRCPRLRGEPHEIRYVAARRRGYISCPHCGHANVRIQIEDVRQPVSRVPTVILEAYLLRMAHPEHLRKHGQIIRVAQAELLVRAEMKRPWQYGETWLDCFRETGERPDNGEPNPGGPDPPPAMAPEASAVSGSSNGCEPARGDVPPRTPLSTLLQALDGLEQDSSPARVDTQLRALVTQLEGSDLLTRALARTEAIDRLEKVGVRSPARLVDAAFSGLKRTTDDGKTQGQAILLTDPDPWPEPVDGSELLQDLVTTVQRFVGMAVQTAIATVLWIVHAHAFDAAEVSSILGITSPTKRCGKTTLLMVIGALVPRPLPAASLTPASVFRAIEKHRPTLLVDEADTFLSQSDELRGVLNAGHTRQTAVVIRTVGDDHEPKVFSTWTPKAIALIGRLPETLADRSIGVEMRRRARGEKIERFRLARLKEMEPHRQRCARWAKDCISTLNDADPGVPEDLDDRAADNWRPLLAIADAVGGDWPALAREAARALSGQDVRADTSPRIEVLADIKAIFTEMPGNRDRVTSAALVAALVALEDRPWSNWRRGRPLTQRQLADLLKPFGVEPKSIRIDDKTPKGYMKVDFSDAFMRYLPGEPHSSDPQHPQQDNGGADFRRFSDPQHGGSVADRKDGASPDKEKVVADVADENPGEQAELWEG